MTVGESVLLAGLMMNAIAIVLAAWLNSRKFGIVIADVHKIELATNSMKDELVAATKTAALLQGNAKGRIALKAEQDADAAVVADKK